VLSPAPITAPAQDASADARLEMIDALRGMALFGVFLMNFAGTGGTGILATSRQLLELPTAWLDFPLAEVARWLISDKANSIFAFLFGLGFWLQLQRADARGKAFSAMYCRRLTVLFALGVLHVVFLFFWDILHLYALAGFALLAFRGLAPRTLFWLGIALATGSRIAHEFYLDWASARFGWPNPFAPEFALERQRLAHAGDYVGLFRAFAEFNTWDWIVGGGVVAWILYALGRFMLGAWVGGRGWLQHPQRYEAGFRRVMRVALPAGLILEGIGRVMTAHKTSGLLPPLADWAAIAKVVHFIAAPTLATGYVCALAVMWQSVRARRWLAPFAAVGRMALTNYVAQSFIYGFVLFGVGPGLGLGGRIGFATIAGIAVIAFAGQIVFSRWWLSRYRNGPLEWVWRSVASGEWKPLRLPVRVGV
jgi:uncharacterized protein